MKKKINSKLHLIAYTAAVILAFNVPGVVSQTGKSWNIYLSNGFSFALDGKIYERDYYKLVDFLPVIGSRLQVEEMEVGIGKMLAKRHELGIAFGKTSFTYPDRITFDKVINESGQVISVPAYETNGWYYQSSTLISVYYQFYFTDDLSGGAKISRKLGQSYFGVYGFFVEKKFKLSEPIYFKLNLNYRYNSGEFANKEINSQMLLFNFGIGFWK